MSFGGLDLQALRNELGAAKQERVALLQHASELEQELGLGSGALLTTMQEETATCHPQPPPPEHSGPRKLSWGARPPVSAAQQQAPLSCPPSSATPASSSGARSGDVSDQVSSALPPHPIQGGAAQVGGGTSGAAAMAAVEEQSRKRVLKEVLAAMLGEAASPMIEHMQLSVATVLAVAEDKEHKAAEDARRVANDKARKERVAKLAVVEGAGTEAEKRRAVAVRQLEESVEKLQRELEALQKEKKLMVSRSSQQSKLHKESSETIKALKELVAGLELKVEHQSKQISKAQSDVRCAKAEGSKRVEEAEAISEKRARELCERHQKELGEVTQGQQSELLAVNPERSCSSQAQQMIASSARDMFDALARELGGLMELMVEVQGDVGRQLADMGAEIDQLKADSVVGTVRMKAEVAAARTDFESVVGGFRAACSTAARHCNDRADDLLRLDSQLSTLGPGGLDSLLLQVATSSAQVTQLEALRDGLQLELRSSEESRRKLMTEHQNQASEFVLLSSTHAEMAHELEMAVARAKAADSEGRQLRRDISEAQDESKKAKRDLEKMEIELEAARQQLATSSSKIKDLSTTISKLTEALKDGVRQAEDFAPEAGRQAMLAAAGMIKGLRSKYFLTSSTTPATSPREPTESTTHGDAHSTLSPSSSGRPPLRTPKLTGESSTPRGRHPAKVGESGGPSSTLIAGEWGLEPVVGLRHCDLSHDEVTQALEGYVKRQAKVMSAAAGALGGESLDLSLDLSEVVMGELLWLEGCVLMVLVENRQNRRELEKVAVLEDEVAEHRVKREANEKQAPARGLASQMMRALAAEKRTLQKQLFKMEGKGKETEQPASFLSYAPQRRSISARMSPAQRLASFGNDTASGLLTAAPPSLPMGLAPCGDRTRRSSEPSNIGAGQLIAANEAVGKVNAVEAWMDQATEKGRTVPPPPEENVPPAGRTAAAPGGGNRQSYDVDEVMAILGNLDEDPSGLRRNRSIPVGGLPPGDTSSRAPKGLPRGPPSSGHSVYSRGTSYSARTPYGTRSKY